MSFVDFLLDLGILAPVQGGCREAYVRTAEGHGGG